ncbi:nucleoside/nucleotide kinase family protein [Saccharothrix violaceirubra]|uniref:Pantothenate kinase n=1 Tax=Saccharothrix violaceirubra TaxID=413306 RepID=A0A7W7TAC9_9PSEU|nr:nucleoside/nucleotide kinase family protein [Saccharothrix violaceirubra]MBB4969474.1 pantothenate kinase [Saccharothrix violaceirubra]
MIFDDLLARANALAATGERRLLGIAGAPGSGKSTLAKRLVDALEGRAALVPMDGFHLAQGELERLGRTDRKGAPDTFDANGYAHLLSRLRDRQRTVYAPEFRREIEEPIANALPVHPDVPLVITEGNYLLVWDEVRALLDETWFLNPDEEVRRTRLVERHIRYGRTPENARHRVLHGVDHDNAVLVAAHPHADLVVD